LIFYLNVVLVSINHHCEFQVGINSRIDTINDKFKSFEGEKFHGLLGSSGMWGKVIQFSSITMHLYTFMVFQLYKTATKHHTKHFNESFTFLTWILFKTVISILWNEQEYIILTYVCAYCRFYTFQNDHAVAGGEARATVKVSPRRNRSLTAS